MTITQLYHVNGGSAVVITCANCGAQLHDERERAATSSPSGPKFFCKMDPGDKVEDSCFMQWKLRRH